MKKTRTIVRQAGAIVYGVDNAIPHVLMVKAKKNPSHWIFPKGHIERGETAEDAAVRELLEEAGVRGKPVRRAGESSYKLLGKLYNVEYFLLKYISTKHDGERGRKPRWCAVDNALSLLSFTDSRELLKKMVPYIRK